ncbi:MAG TPA: hypothetical protein PLU50_05350, partial [Pseudobdellovibrionaceae bacterium]|nr:hypothetical protein [Pseudobdellovibrionaceae bacterium]
MSETLRDFFIIVASELQEECLRELDEVLKYCVDRHGQSGKFQFEIKSLKGGIHLSAPFEIGLQLNFFMRLPTRNLLRVGRFRAKDFPTLFNKISSLHELKNFGRFVYSVESSTHESRLTIRHRIEETTLAALEKLGVCVPKGESSSAQKPMGIWVRIDSDEVTVSLDTSGEILHKRGWGEMRTQAPLRSNFAAFFLRRLCSGFSPEELAKINLIDPCCGSGTFLWEAVTGSNLLNRRHFAFLDFNNCPKILRSPSFFKNIQNVKSNEFASLRGFDVSDEAVEVALKIRSSQSEFGQIQIAKRDLFDPSNQHGLENAQNWVIANVPYGVRLDAFDVQKAYEVLRSHWRPQRMLLVMSHEQG